MNNQIQQIPCPVCQTPIPFHLDQLLGGAKFTCNNCAASVGIANNSKPVVAETMDKFNEMKNGLNLDSKTTFTN